MRLPGCFYKHGDYAWVQGVRGDYLCVHNGNLVATITSNAWEDWRVIRHLPERALMLSGEYFENPFEAMSRIEEIMEDRSTRVTYFDALPDLVAGWRSA